MKLSEAQRRSLLNLAAGLDYEVRRERFATMEVLRRMGFAERESWLVASGVYADKNGEHEQRWHGWWHRWFITPAGLAALKTGGEGA